MTARALALSMLLALVASPACDDGGDGDADADADTDGDGDVDTDGDGDVDAHAIDFVIRNVSGAVTFIDWSYEATVVVTGQRETGGAWEPIHFIQPSSCMMLGCESVEPGDPDSCHVPPCGIMCAVRELAPDGEAVASWDGRVLYAIEEETCPSGCYRAQGVSHGRYRAVVCANDSFACSFDPPCGPTGDGVYEPAQLEAGGPCFETEFTIPYPGDQVVIEIE